MTSPNTEPLRIVYFCFGCLKTSVWSGCCGRTQRMYQIDLRPGGLDVTTGRQA